MNKRQQKRLLKLAVAIILIGGMFLYEKLATSNQGTLGQTTPAGSYRVVNVDDGDTVTVDMNGQEEKVRMIGVDTPETKDPRKPVQCFGYAASDFTKQLIGQNAVRLESDPDNTNRDRYNRLLRYVYLPDGTLVNAKIIQEGYGFAYTSFPFGKKDEFKNLEIEARQQNRGLWASCDPEPNKYGGYDSNPDPPRN